MLKEIEALEKESLADLLKGIAALPDVKAAFSTSLSWEDQVVSHHIFSQQLPIRIFTLDTGRLFAETYSVLNATRDR